MGSYPVRVSSRPEPVSRWLWLVKWLLLIPHYLVLAVLWVAFVVLTIVAYVAVLFTGRYPRAIFEFNVGVLRWTWRAGYYGYWVLGTDRYPPFTLADAPDYPARLQVDGPPTPKRWLPLVAWLFAVPHLILVAALTSGFTWVVSGEKVDVPGLAGLAVLIAAVALLFTGRHPTGLYNLLVGAWRWYLRVVAYVALLTDRYPPLRLDLGADEPDSPPPPVATATSTAAAPPAPTAAASATSGSRSAARIVGSALALFAGVLLFLTGSGLLIGGGTLLAVNAARDDGGYVSTGTVELSSGTAAITAEGIEVHPANVFGRQFTGLDGVRVKATGTDDRALFVGVARESDVDAWLRGTGHDEVADLFDPDGVRYDRAIGPARAVESPASQPFWLATASGTDTVTLTWQPGDGRYAIVLANADGTAGVTADTTVEAKLPVLRSIGWSLIGGGLLTAVSAAALIFSGAAGLSGAAGGVPGPGTPRSGPGGPPAEPARPRVPVSTGG